MKYFYKMNVRYLKRACLKSRHPVCRGGLFQDLINENKQNIEIPKQVRDDKFDVLEVFGQTQHIYRILCLPEQFRIKYSII